jgi:hypothetical protein
MGAETIQKAKIYSVEKLQSHFDRSVALRREAEKSAFGVLSEVEGSMTDSSTPLRQAQGRSE